ncbi:zinc ribbon domain-containing protein [Nocardia sp. NPDC003482]
MLEILLRTCFGGAGAIGIPEQADRHHDVEPVLSNPYFVGIVVYKGVYHQGKHPALTDMETWLRVPDVLKAHNTAGEKDRRHPHYLKGSIWCRYCGRHMVYSRNQGKLGGWYEYFFCMGKKDRGNRCPCPDVKAGRD